MRGMRILSTLCVIWLLTVANVYGQVNYVWNGSVSSQLSDPANWTPNGLPSETDNITLNSAGFSPVSTDSVSYKNVTISSGTPDLGGYPIYVTGNLILSGGTISNGHIHVQSGTANTATLSTATLASDCRLTVVTGGISVNGGTYHGPVVLEQTGTSATTGTGGATFNSTLSIINSGTGNFRINGNVIYNGDVSFETRSTGYLLPELTTGSTYNANLTSTISAAGNIRLAYAGTNNYNGNITVNSSSTGYIYFGELAGASATLANGKTISAGSFTDGRLYLYRFTQNGATAQNITLSGTAYLTLGPALTFNAPVTLSSPQIALNGGTYNSAAVISKTGASNNNSTGNNIFNSTLSLNNSGTGYILLSNTTRDLYHQNTTFNLSAAGSIYIAQNDAVGTMFHADIILNNTGTGNIYFGQGTGLTQFTPGKFITIGPSGFAAGAIYLRNFVQSGTDDITFNSLSGTAAIYLQSGNVFSGNVDVSAPQVYLNGSTYNANVRIEKTGATNNAGTGGNTINGTSTFINSGTGYLMTGNGSGDTFNGDLYCTNTGAGIYLSYNGGGTTNFNGNIELNSTGTNGIQFGRSAATTGLSVMSNGKVISIGALGFSGSGDLRMRSFTYQDPAPLDFTLSGTTRLLLGPATSFACNVNFSAPQLYLQGCIFDGVTALTKTGGTNNDCTGGNTFNGVTTISHNGTANLNLAFTTRDIFNNDATFQSAGTGVLNVGYNDVTGTEFHGNIYVNSSTAGSIRFGQSTGTCILDAGKTIGIGSNFSAGSLYLRNFTQNGSTAQTMNTFSGTSILYLQAGSVFNGDVDFAAPQLYLNGSTYNGNTQLSKNGATNNNGSGGNTFNGITTLTNSGTGYLLTANTSADIFNNTLNIISQSAGAIHLGYAAGTSLFNEDIYVNSSSTGSIQFSASNGYSTLANGKRLFVGGSGFGSGTLLLRHFTQTGTTAQNLTLTGTAIATVGPVSVFNAAIDLTSPQVNLNGATFNGISTIQKTGAGNNTSTGNNVFNASATISNSGTGTFSLATTTADDFNADALFIQTGSGALYPTASTASTFAGNISTAGTSTAIIFGQNANGRVVIDGNTAQSFDGALALKPLVRRLRMATTGALTLNVPVDVSADLNLVNGIINTSSANVLTLTDESATANIGDAGSYVNGPMRYTMNLNGSATLIFPVGKGTDWRPMELTPVHNSTTAYTYTVDMINSSAASLLYLPLPGTIDTVSDVRYWQVDRTPSINANLTSATVKLYYSSSGKFDGVSDPSNLTVVKTTGAGTVWNDIGGTATTANTGTITSGNFTSSGLFTFGNLIGGSNPLPVSLISFTAVKNSHHIDVKWSTASEMNNDYFVVEKSNDGVTFDDMIQVDGAGNSNSVLNYSAVDEVPFTGNNFYRLRQVDFDGKATLSRIINVAMSNELTPVTFYPNPVKDIISIEYPTYSQNTVEFIIYTIQGQQVKSFSVEPHDGMVRNNFDLTALASGSYWLKAVSDESVQAVRIIKQ